MFHNMESVVTTRHADWCYTYTWFVSLSACTIATLFGGSFFSSSLCFCCLTFLHFSPVFSFSCTVILPLFKTVYFSPYNPSKHFIRQLCLTLTCNVSQAGTCWFSWLTSTHQHTWPFTSHFKRTKNYCKPLALVILVIEGQTEGGQYPK